MSGLEYFQRCHDETFGNKMKIFTVIKVVYVKF